MTEKKTARYYQKIGKDVYRVSGAVRRSAVTGQYVIDSSVRRRSKAKSSVSAAEQ